MIDMTKRKYYHASIDKIDIGEKLDPKCKKDKDRYQNFIDAYIESFDNLIQLGYEVLDEEIKTFMLQQPPGTNYNREGKQVLREYLCRPVAKNIVEAVFDVYRDIEYGRSKNSRITSVYLYENYSDSETFGKVELLRPFGSFYVHTLISDDKYLQARDYSWFNHASKIAFNILNTKSYTLVDKTNIETYAKFYFMVEPDEKTEMKEYLCDADCSIVIDVSEVYKK